MRLVRVVDKSTIITENYTEAIWLAIRATKEIDWVRKGGLIPQTMVWNVWLDEAKLNASNGNANWPATKRKDELLLEDALAKEASNQDDDMSQPKRRPTLL